MKFIIGIVSFIISAFSVILIETIFLSGLHISGASTIQDGTSTTDIFGLVNFILIGGLTKVVYNYLLNLYNKKFTFQYKPIDLDDDSPFKYTRENKQENTTNDDDEEIQTNNRNYNINNKEAHIHSDSTSSWADLKKLDVADWIIVATLLMIFLSAVAYKFP